MKGTSVVKNYIFNLTYQSVLALSPILTQPYLARVLGRAEIGEYVLSQTIVSYFVLFCTFGFNVFGQREIAYVGNKKSERGTVLCNIVVAKIILFVVAMCVYILIVLNNVSNKLIYAIQLIDIISVIFDFAWFFQGVENFKIIAIRNCLARVSSLILIFLCVKEKNDLPIYVLISSVTLLLSNLSYIFYLREYANIKFTMINEGKIKLYFKFSLWMFLPQACSSIYTVVDKTMLGLIAGVSEVASYDYSQKIIYIVLSVMTSVGVVMMPRVAALYSEKKLNEVHEYIYNSVRFVFCVSFPVLVIIFEFSDWFALWFWGENFKDAGNVLRILSIILVFVGMSNVIGIQYLIPTGREKEFSKTLIAGSVFNFTVNVCLIRYFGLEGMCITSVLTEGLILILQLRAVRSDIKCDSFIFISCKYAVASLVMWCAVRGLLLIFEFNILTNSIILVISILIYMFSLYLMNEKLVRIVLDKIR